MTTRRLDRRSTSPEAPEAPVEIEVEVDAARPDGTRPVRGRAAARVGELIGRTPESEAASQERTAHGALASQSRAGRYVLAFELASGGMATVFLARFEGAAGFTRAVALKRVHMHLSRDPRFVDMFLDEAKITARLSHPNVCAVTDFGQDAEGGYYLAMEYLAGETLAKVARAALRTDDRAPLDPRYRRFVAHLLAEACEGLHAAHEARGSDGAPLEIVHRDVTPNNLFVTFDGVLKVVDFGIAKARDRVTHTDTGEFKGSLPYISPEHARSREADRRADVWSLGVCAWELLSGQRLFKRQTPADTLYAVLEDPVPRLDEVQPGVPAAYADAVERALRRTVEERWATARELGQALLRASEADGPRPGAAEVSAWLDELFPGTRESRRRLVQRALTVTDGPSTLTSPGPRAVEGAGTHRRPERRSPLVLAGAALLGLGAIGGVAWAFGRGGPETTTPSAAVVLPSSAEPPPAIDEPIAEPAEPVASAEPPAAVATVEPSEASEPAAIDAERERRPRPRRGAPEPPTPTESPPVEPTPEPARARPRPAETAAPATGDGTVVVVVPDGWAEVYDGGRRLGQTPLRTTLPAGGHELEVRIEGHAPGRRLHADVRAGETTRLVVRASE